jgi:very-short-patch-repair endonuclease
MAFQSEKANERARELRKRDTEAERRLWEALRDRRLAGLKFVRQLPIGLYFADFACRSERLVVEVDGATHGDAPEIEHDAKREAFLNKKGWKVHRCWNQDVFENLPGVCDSILIALKRG